MSTAIITPVLVLVVGLLTCWHPVAVIASGSEDAAPTVIRSATPVATRVATP